MSRHGRLTANRFFGFSSGAGSALCRFCGGGAATFMMVLSIASLNFTPTSPKGASFAASTRAASAHLALTCACKEV